MKFLSRTLMAAGIIAMCFSVVVGLVTIVMWAGPRWPILTLTGGLVAFSLFLGALFTWAEWK
jgi:hypothetical protein